MDIEHPDITHAMATGYDRSTWRRMNEEHEEDHDFERDKGDEFE